MRKLVYGLGLALAVALVGCDSGGAPTEKVTGTVTAKGQPVSQATVTFTPENGRPASGVTDAQGKFTLSTFKEGDGAVPGTHNVAIIPFKGEGPEPMPGTPEAANYKPPVAPFSQKYTSTQTSGLTAEVKSGPNDFQFDLPE
jgi:hypothetical protein